MSSHDAPSPGYLGSVTPHRFSGYRVAALGGGHGLYASLSALRLLTSDISAVVTVADDGGSSGRIREQFGVLPPGDLRMALSALCDNSEWGHLWRAAVQHRFLPDSQASQELEGHAMGNLLLLSLWQLLEDPVAGLDWASRLLKVRGRVLPMALDPLVISGTARDAAGLRQQLTGQANLAKAARVEDLVLEPQDARGCPESVAAIREADWVFMGPGSWFTSVVPHLLFEPTRRALCETTAGICVVMNLGLEEKETTGLGAVGHLEALEQYAPELRLDAVVADPSAVVEQQEFEEAVAARGARTVWADLRDVSERDVHHTVRLAAALQEVMDRQPRHGVDPARQDV